MQHYGEMRGWFLILPRDIDKSFRLAGGSLDMKVDYDDVNHEQVLAEAKALVDRLNAKPVETSEPNFDIGKAGQRTRRQNILATVSDLVSNFLYYNRKEDEDLPMGEIEKAVKAGEITVDEITAFFAKKLKAGIGS